MPYVLIDNGVATRDVCCNIEELLKQFNDMYEYAVYLTAIQAFVVAKHGVQPDTPWDYAA